MGAAAALHGLVVIALEQAVAAPLCTERLAAAGARVIKIERAEGGDFARGYDRVVHGESAYFAWLNRGKESIVLNIKDGADAVLLHRMLARADVFVQNLSPGASARAGFDSVALRRKYPRLITCDISGYGDEGPLAHMKAYDLLVQCESGLASITGSPSEPGRVGVSVADIGCGMNAHAAILQALFHRERAGEGAGVSVSLFDGLADWMTVPLLHQDYGDSPPVRVGLNHATITPYGAYKTADGDLTVLAIQNQREWMAFCSKVLVRPELATDQRFENNASRCENRTELDKLIIEILKRITRDDLVVRLEAANVAYGRVNGLDGLSQHAQLRRTVVSSPSGPVSLPAIPLRWHEGHRELGAIPGLNEHGHKLRAEFDVVRVETLPSPSL